jgi:hypothetical protein
MKRTVRGRAIFHWVPRALAIAFIVFIGLFALDVFTSPNWFVPLLTHLIPNYILIILTVIAWKHERVGGTLFLAGGLGSVLFFHSLILALPCLLIGILFIVATL